MTRILANRRAQERFSVRIKVHAEVQSAPGAGDLVGKQIKSKTRDISLGGLCIYSEDHLPTNTELLVTITLGWPEKIFRHVGNVMWCTREETDSKYKAGIQLKNNPADEPAWKETVLGVLAG